MLSPLSCYPTAFRTTAQSAAPVRSQAAARAAAAATPDSFTRTPSPLDALLAKAGQAAERGDAFGFQQIMRHAIDLQAAGSAADGERVQAGIERILAANPALARTDEGRAAIDQIRLLSSERATGIRGAGFSTVDRGRALDMTDKSRPFDTTDRSRPFDMTDRGSSFDLTDRSRR